MNMRRLGSLIVTIVSLCGFAVATSNPASAAGGPLNQNTWITVNSDLSLSCQRWYPNLLTVGKCNPANFLTDSLAYDPSGSSIGFTTTLVTAKYPHIQFVQGNATYEGFDGTNYTGADTVIYTDPARIVAGALKRCDDVNPCEKLGFVDDYIALYVPKFGQPYSGGIG